MQHQYFQGFIPQQDQVHRTDLKATKELAHNSLVFEISNNWEHVVKLVARLNKQEQIQVDPLQLDWLNFLKSNNIDIAGVESGDIFVDKYLKPLVNE